MKKPILFFCAIFCFLNTFSQTEKEKVEATVSKNKIESHIYFLSEDLLKGRETGSAENKIAASYLANTLRGYGVKPVLRSETDDASTERYYQPVKLNIVKPVKKFYLKINGKEYKKKVAIKANGTKFQGNAVYLGYGLESDYKSQDVSKKVVVIKGGGPDAKGARAAFGLREQKEELALQHGALAVIELVDADENVWNFIEHSFNAEKLEVAHNGTSKNKALAYLWLQDPNGAYISGLKTGEPIPIEFSMGAQEKTPLLSQNVVGMVEGSDPILRNEFIIYSAHYDHVGIGRADATGDSIYNGARDNAVGTTTVLSMAENLAKYPTKRSALFILFTGEEKGMLGSQYYVENPLIPLKQMVYCFNSDNAGYNDTSIATIVGMKRTGAAKNIQEAAQAFGLKAIDDPEPEQQLFDRSDNVHFAEAGIPSPTFSLGFTAFEGDTSKYYHQPSDEADTLDYDYLLKFFESYVLAGRLIANDPQTPKWESGDKYEAAAKKLYAD